MILFLFALTFSMGEAALPSFEEGDCPFFNIDPNITCGRLTVPKHHLEDNGETIQLPVMIISSQSPDKKPDPILFLNGGPGANSMSLPAAVSLKKLPFEDRDIVVFNIRGTAHTQINPCPEINQKAIDLLVEDLSPEDYLAKNEALGRDCIETMQKNKLDFNLYSSRENAYDMEALRQALNYPEWNLLGVSYGTRYALTAMRDQGEHIRSVILDSVVPLQSNLPEDYTYNVARTMEHYFTLVEASHPQTRQKLFEVLKRLETEPIVMELGGAKRFVLNSQDLWSIMLGFFMSDKIIPAFPIFIDQLHKGNTHSLKLFSFLATLGGLEQGALLSTICYEDYPSKDERSYPEDYRHFSDGKILLEICKSWPTQAASLEQEPVVSEIPTLIINGSLDFGTPDYYAEMVHQDLPNSSLFILPTSGHNVSFENSALVNELLKSFVDKPTEKPQLATPAPTEIETWDVRVTSGLFKFAEKPIRFIFLIASFLFALVSLLFWPLHLWRRKGESHRASFLCSFSGFLFLLGTVLLVASLIGVAKEQTGVLLVGLPQDFPIYLFWLPLVCGNLSIAALIMRKKINWVSFVYAAQALAFLLYFGGIFQSGLFFLG